MKFKVGDRVYCLGIKMVVISLFGVSCYGKQLVQVGFGNATIIRASDELKPIITVKNV